MKDSFFKHINTNFPNLKEKKLLIACSGGLDSVSLSYLMKELGYKIALAHCNFSLRGKESDTDEAFVETLAIKWNIPFFSETFSTKEYAKNNKLSTQMAARELRYQWFDEILKDFKYDYVITAHHADDDLETFLINLSRGTGLKGLTGIPTKNKTVLRPFLPFSRHEIFQFAKKENLFWREDSSNLSKDYLRNKIRFEVVPAYKESQSKLLQNFQKTQYFLKQSEALIENYIALVSRLIVTPTHNGIAFSITKLQDLPNKEALLFHLLEPYGFSAWADIKKLIAAQSGKQIFSKTHRLLKDRTVLLLTTIPHETEVAEKYISENETQIAHPISLSFIPSDKIGYIEATSIYVDKDKLFFPLSIRKWKEGDIFQPFGMKGKKKLSKFFKDEKLSLADKEKIWVLLSQNNIVWVVGLRADDRYKVTEQTRQILKISLKH